MSEQSKFILCNHLCLLMVRYHYFKYVLYMYHYYWENIAKSEFVLFPCDHVLLLFLVHPFRARVQVVLSSLKELKPHPLLRENGEESQKLKHLIFMRLKRVSLVLVVLLLQSLVLLCAANMTHVTLNPSHTEMDPLVESPATSSSHIHSPCFSVYELRNKLFSESNAVYAYTYKNQIKTLKPPLHWVTESCII